MDQVNEAGLKEQLGRLKLDLDLVTEAREHGFQALPMTAEHAVAGTRLPPHHGDPFGRLLLGQALVEKLTLVTRDAALERYDVPLLKA